MTRLISCSLACNGNSVFCFCCFATFAKTLQPQLARATRKSKFSSCQKAIKKEPKGSILIAGDETLSDYCFTLHSRSLYFAYAKMSFTMFRVTSALRFASAPSQKTILNCFLRQSAKSSDLAKSEFSPCHHKKKSLAILLNQRVTRLFSCSLACNGNSVFRFCCFATFAKALQPQLARATRKSKFSSCQKAIKKEPKGSILIAGDETRTRGILLGKQTFYH